MTIEENFGEHPPGKKKYLDPIDALQELKQILPDENIHFSNDKDTSKEIIKERQRRKDENLRDNLGATTGPSDDES